MTVFEQLNRSRFLLITDRKASAVPLTERIEQACRADVGLIQLREKDLQGKALYDLASEISEITRRHNACLIINDRVDIALAIEAGGIHLPEHSLPVETVRRIIGDGRIIGKSTHRPEDALSAEQEGADYVIFGPVFETPSKVRFGPAQGLDKLEQVCSGVKIPVFAVGGITAERASACLNAGAHGVAVIRAMMQSDNVEADLIQFKQTIGTL